MTLKTEALQERLLNAIREHAGNLLNASNACGVSRYNHYKWLKIDPDYYKRYEEVCEEIAGVAYDALNDALKGKKTKTVVKKEKYDKNGVLIETEILTTITEHKPSETLIMFALNNRGKFLGFGRQKEEESEEQNQIQQITGMQIINDADTVQREGESETA